MAEPIIGIDLGTTNSLVAVFGDDGPALVPNALGDVMTPSCVGLDDAGDLLVGRPARDRLMTHPALTTARFKRYMGTDRQLKIGKTSYRAEDLSAMVLMSLKADAETALRMPVEHAVISVPAYFNHVQRRATINAAKLAGLKVNRLVNEPTAAALAYGLDSLAEDVSILILDLGGGTFDVSILEVFEGIMEVRASSGDAFLGGEDFTDLLARAFAKDLGKAGEKLDAGDQARLTKLAERQAPSE